MATDKHKLIQELLNFQNKFNKSPAYNDYMKYPDDISSGAKFAYAFGSFNKALEIAGIPKFYDKKPDRHCNNCNEILSNHQKMFCSSSCSATSNNRKRARYRECIQCSSQFLVRRSNAKFCSVVCKNNHIIEESDRKIEAGLCDHAPTHRKYLTRTRGYKCEWCEVSEWRNEPITLECDHIDGDPDNNFPSNLRLLCPNCHSQTPTFRRSNIGNHKSDKRSLHRRKRYHS